MKPLRVFSTRLAQGERRVYGAVLVYFCLVFAAMLWPIYPLFGAARPLVAGLPLSLAYLAFLLIVSFTVLGSLYLWESRRGRLDPDHESGQATGGERDPGTSP